MAEHAMRLDNNAGHTIFAPMSAAKLRAMQRPPGFAGPPSVVDEAVPTPLRQGYATADASAARAQGSAVASLRARSAKLLRGLRSEDMTSALEQCAPHATTLLKRTWGQPEAERAFRVLILDKDGKVRHWPPEAWADLLFPRNLHRIAHVLNQVPEQSSDAAADAVTVAQTQFSALESHFSHVAERIQQCWGDCDAFATIYHDLIFDDRGERDGWPPEVWSELVLLQAVHDRVCAMP